MVVASCCGALAHVHGPPLVVVAVNLAVLGAARLGAAATSPPLGAGDRPRRRAAGLPRHGHRLRRRRPVPHRAHGAAARWVEPARRGLRRPASASPRTWCSRRPIRLGRHRDRAEQPRRAHRAAHPASRCSRPARKAPALGRERRGRGCAALLDEVRRPGLPGLLRAARRQDRDLLPERQGGRRLPRRRRRDAGLRRPARRPRGVAAGDPGLAGGGGRYAWTPGVVGASRGRRDRLPPGRSGLPRAGRRGGPRPRGVLASTGGRCAVVRQAVNRVAARRLHPRRPPPARADAPRRSPRWSATAEALRERGRRARLLDGAGPARRPAGPRAWSSPAARDGEGRLVAVLAFVPWGADGLSLDLMRRAQDSENGTVEFVVAGVVEAGRGLGVTRISLNFAVFRSVFERGVAGRRRAGAAAVAPAAADRLALVADRVAVPRERQVPAGVGAALRVLPQGRRAAAGRHGRRSRPRRSSQRPRLRWLATLTWRQHHDVSPGRNAVGTHVRAAATAAGPARRPPRRRPATSSGGRRGRRARARTPSRSRTCRPPTRPPWTAGRSPVRPPWRVAWSACWPGRWHQGRWRRARPRRSRPAPWLPRRRARRPAP